ncbi:peptidoglycan DD-metalloendopeptidase family protein, partial [Thermodesulfobacteriota bacterium]
HAGGTDKVSISQRRHDKAEFVKESMRDGSVVFYGEVIEKSWTFRNVGDRPWSKHYRWEFEKSGDGETLAEERSFALEEQGAPGSEHTLRLLMTVPVFNGDEREIDETWRLVDGKGAPVEGASGIIKVKAVRCPIADAFEYPVGYPILGVERQAYEVNWDFLDPGYDMYGWHHSEDWNGRANGGGNTDVGDPVYAIGHGCVVARKTKGNHILLVRHLQTNARGRHEPVYARYYHLNDVLVNVGDVVYRGQKIATIGKTGKVKGAHLDFGILKDAFFTVDRWREYQRLGGTINWEKIKSPPSYDEAAVAWICSSSNCRKENQHQWIMDTFYNPCDHTVNESAKQSPDYDLGDLFRPANNDIVVDDTDSGCTRTGDKWKKQENDPYRQYHYFPDNPNEAAGHAALWRPVIPQIGVYDVFAGFWSSMNEPAEVEYEIRHAGGTDKVSISQRRHDKAGRVWHQVRLGRFRFQAGSTGYVGIEEAPNANVDQICFKSAPEDSLPPDPADGDEPAADRAALCIETVPALASVLLDEQSIGETPFARIDLDPGPHKLTLSRQGYVPLTLPVYLMQGETLELTSLPLARQGSTVTIWRVGCPYRGDVPTASIQGDVEAIFQGMGLNVRVRGIGADAFPAAFLQAFNGSDETDLPDIVTGTNYMPVEKVMAHEDVAASMVYLSKSPLEAIDPIVLLVKTSPNHGGAFYGALHDDMSGIVRGEDTASLDGQLQSVDDFQTLRALNYQAMYAYVRGGAELLSSLANPDMIEIAWPPGHEPRGIAVAGMRPLCFLGNPRLVAAIGKASFLWEKAIGFKYTVSMWMKEQNGWRLLCITDDPRSLDMAVDEFPRIAHGLNLGQPMSPVPAQLVSPADGAYPEPSGGERFGDFLWRPSSSANMVAEIAEFHYGRANRLVLPDRGTRVSTGELWSTGGPWKWRIWSIGRNGEVTFSEARGFRH